MCVQLLRMFPLAVRRKLVVIPSFFSLFLFFLAPSAIQLWKTFERHTFESHIAVLLSESSLRLRRAAPRLTINFFSLSPRSGPGFAIAR